jgi:hypothetical protein
MYGRLKETLSMAVSSAARLGIPSEAENRQRSLVVPRCLALVVFLVLALPAQASVDPHPFGINAAEQPDGQQVPPPDSYLRALAAADRALTTGFAGTPNDWVPTPESNQSRDFAFAPQAAGTREVPTVTEAIGAPPFASATFTYPVNAATAEHGLCTFPTIRAQRPLPLPWRPLRAALPPDNQAPTEFEIDPGLIADIVRQKPDADSRSNDAKPKTLERLHNKRKLEIIVIGDSLGTGYWQGIYKLRSAYSSILIKKDTMRASGLTAFEWHKRVTMLLRKKQYDVALVALGINDKQILLQESRPRRLRYSSESWIAKYQERIRGIMQLLEENDVHAYWLGLPTVRDKSTREHAAFVNSIFETIASEFPHVTFLPLDELTAGPDGAYSAYGQNLAGNKVRLRLKDGIHFTLDGYKVVGNHILRRIFADYPLAAPNATVVGSDVKN